MSTMKMFRSQRSIIDVFGGPTELAELLTKLTGDDYSKQRVGMWQSRGLPQEVKPLLDAELTARLRRAVRRRPKH